jgi:hypothetical protein
MQNATWALALALLAGCENVVPPRDAALVDTAPEPDASGVAGMLYVRGAAAHTFSTGATVGIPGGVEPQPRPVSFWTGFRMTEDVCESLRVARGQPGTLWVVLYGAEEGGAHLAPTDGTYPVHPGIAGGASVIAQLLLEVEDYDGPPSGVYGATGTVRFEGSDDPAGPRLFLDAVLEDGTTVQGSLQTTWCAIVGP